MRHAVRLVNKEARNLGTKDKPDWVRITEDIFLVVVEAPTKDFARKKVRQVNSGEYADTVRFKIGRISKTDKEIGRHELIASPLASDSWPNA